MLPLVPIISLLKELQIQRIFIISWSPLLDSSLSFVAPTLFVPEFIFWLKIFHPPASILANVSSHSCKWEISCSVNPGFSKNFTCIRGCMHVHPPLTLLHFFPVFVIHISLRGLFSVRVFSLAAQWTVARKYVPLSRNSNHFMALGAAQMNTNRPLRECKGGGPPTD